MPYTADASLKAFVRQLPKTETHLHMEGACPYELLKAMDPVKYANPPAFWDDDFRYESFDQFMELYVDYCSTFFTSAKRYHDAAKIVLKNCVDQGWSEGLLLIALKPLSEYFNYEDQVYMEEEEGFKVLIR